MGVGERDTRANAATITVAASDSPFRTRADYVCDGTDDATEINLAIEKIKSIGGKVRLMAGHFYLHTVGILQRQAIYLEGEGLGATFLSAASGHSLTADSGLITLETKTTFTGGGIKGLSLIGDGTISGVTSRAAVDATIDGIDATGAATIKLYNITDCYIEKFRRGLNTEGTYEEVLESINTEWRYNTYGVWMQEHVNFNGGGLKLNDIGVGGKAYDVLFRNVRTIRNRIGITSDRYGTNYGIEAARVTGGVFFANAEQGLVLHGNNNITGVHFATDKSTADAWITVKGNHNHLTGNVLQSQTETAGAAGVAVHIDAPIYGLNISGGYIKNYGGRIFKITDTKQVYGLNISGVSFAVGAYPLFSEQAGEGKLCDSSFCNNNIFCYKALDAPLIEIQTIGNVNWGNKWNDNTIYATSGSTVPTCFFKGDLTNSSLCNNNLQRLLNYSVPILDASTVTTNAMVYNNSGGDTFTPVICNHGATAATARPPWPGVVQWIGSVEPTNAAANDIWINTG